MAFHGRWAAGWWVSGVLILLSLASGCGDNADVSVETTVAPADMVDEGSWYAKAPWPHDGAPHESEHFTVYSDSSSLEARKNLAVIVEDLYIELLDEFGIVEDLLVFPSDQDKIHVMAFRDQEPPESWEARAYYAGLIVRSLDHENRDSEPSSYMSVVRHELIHVFESLLKGEAAAQEHHTEVWFSEGLAEAMTGGNAGPAIRGLDYFNDLLERHPNRNPIAMKYDDLSVDPTTYADYIYPMFQLAVEYLLDEDGFAKAPSDAAGVFRDMGAGAYFPEAFEDNFGITVNDYRDEFFGHMAGYLPERSGSIVFGPLGLALISLAAVGIAVASSTWSVRRSPAAMAADGSPETTTLTQGSRIGFAAWIVVVSTLSLGLFLRGVFAIGESHVLEDAEKALGLAVLIGYAGVSAVVLTWAVRRRPHHSGTAWVIPLLAIGAAGVTTIVIGWII